MNNSDDKNSEILKETAVYDYVAGNQSEAARRNFEKLLKNDVALQKAVISERALRDSLRRGRGNKSVSKSNFDKLLSRIDELEANELIEQSSINAVTQDAQTNNVITMPNRRIRQFSIAACLAMMGVVAVSFFGQLTEPDFVVLGDQQASKEVNFTQLVSQRRVAKIVLSSQLGSAQIDDVLASYNLTTFESGSSTSNMYVIAERSIDDDVLSQWRIDQRIKKVDVVSYSEEK